MLEIKNVDIKLSTKYLVKSLSLTLNKDDKLAIIGEEGNGKSTLLKAILGKCPYATTTGLIDTHNQKIGYLEQTIDKENLTKRVYNYLFINPEDYYDSLKILYRHLDTLHLEVDILERTLETLSGGEKVKVGLLKLLLEESDVLLLDEPTNDLDIETLKWLEEFILHMSKPIAFVSHDETLLSHTANMILHLEQIRDKTEPRHTLVRMDYDTYVEIRMKAISKQRQIAKSEKREFAKKEEKLKKVMNKVERDQQNISRSDPHGARLLKKKMHSLKAQERRLDATELTELPDIEENIRFAFKAVHIPSSKVVLDLHLPELSVGNKILAHHIDLDVSGPTHLCIIGRNGVGKSTLLKEIYGLLTPREDIKVGYMPQNYDDILKNYTYVLEFASPSSSKDDLTKTRTFLGTMNFTPAETTGKIADLSNGSKAKLLLTGLVLSACDVLILDEPTRNVSPLSNPVIRKVLKEFSGTIISVSHDRKYIEEVADVIYTFDERGLTKKL